MPFLELEGKIKVSNTPEVQALAKQYGWEHVHIGALDISLVQDALYIKQIQPIFDKQTGCIIVVIAGDNYDGYLYQEDQQDNPIYKETLKEFMDKTKDVDPKLMAKFYLSLR